ncbi:predicted protein, partial [Nematostella vectensis]
RIELEKEVESISYSNAGVTVNLTNGNVYTAEHAICTFSSGVLNNGLVNFIPRLPKWKQDALSKVPMSFYTKIFLKFQIKFWEDKEFILHASKRRGDFPVFQNVPINTKEGGVLMATITGSEALRIENQSDEDTRSEVMATLRQLYGVIPEPTEMFYARWSKDPYTRGAYSDPTLDARPCDFDNMLLPLDTLFFAGEATSEEWTGYMQGAYLTGKHAAKRVL